MNCFDSNYYSTGPPPSREKFEMFVDIIGCPKVRVEIFTLALGARACIESTRFRLDACPSAKREGKNFNTHFWAAMVDIRCPIRVECILSCSTTSAFCPANPARGCILAEFCHSLTDFRANLSSLIKASLF